LGELFCDFSNDFSFCEFPYDKGVSPEDVLADACMVTTRENNLDTPGFKAGRVFYGEGISDLLKGWGG
jgi:hypothetical protein